MLTSHTAESVQHAFEIGYVMVDTSADYQTQAGIGKAMRRHDLPRDSLYIVMKVEPEEHGYHATVKNLADLKLAYADLVLIHRAPEKGVGEKLWKQLMQARDDGLTRDIGVCSYKLEKLQALRTPRVSCPRYTSSNGVHSATASTCWATAARNRWCCRPIAR